MLTTPFPVARPIAKPPRLPHYVMPGSHTLDPPFAWRPNAALGRWPFPRAPWPFETESRAAGTGLLWGGVSMRPRPPRPPCPPVPRPPPRLCLTDPDLVECGCRERPRRCHCGCDDDCDCGCCE